MHAYNQIRQRRIPWFSGIFFNILLSLFLLGGGDNTFAATETFNPTGDTYASSDAPDMKFCNELEVAIAPHTDILAYVKFDISSIPSGSVINSAQLQLWCTLIIDNGPVAIGRVSSSWNECDVDWYNQPEVELPVVTSTPLGTGQWWERDVTSIVEEGFIDNASNMGFRLEKLDDGLIMFYSSESSIKPKLVVEYTSGYDPDIRIEPTSLTFTEESSASTEAADPGVETTAIPNAKSPLEQSEWVESVKEPKRSPKEEEEAKVSGPNPAIQMLFQHPKLSDPERILKDFMAGEPKTRVIVNLHKPSHANQLQNLKDIGIRRQLQQAVKQAQDRIIPILNASDARITNRFTYIFGFSAKVSLQGLKDLIDNSNVLSIEKDEILYPHLAQGIPLINATTVRNTYNGSGMSIAICDTGIDYTHSRLGGGGFPNSKVVGGHDTGEDDTDPMDEYGHGTSCAGIAAGDLPTSGDYIGGVAFAARLYAVKMSRADIQHRAYTADMIEAWEWCITHQNDDPSNPIMIISTSFGGDYHTSSCDSWSLAMTTAASNANVAGITLFVSSGNDGFCDGIAWPACISHVNAVGAVYDASIGFKGWCINQDSCTGYSDPVACPSSSGYDEWRCDDSAPSADDVTCYSNSASFLSFFAPSNDCYTTALGGSYNTNFGGTSAACPYAAGAAACLQSAAMAINGSYLTPAEVKSTLTSTGDLITDTKISITKPKINLGAAIGSLSSSFAIYNDGNTDLEITSMTKRDGDPWLSWTPTAPLTIPSGGSQVIAVTVDWDLASTGSNEDQIIVHSNDPDEDPYPDAVFITAEKVYNTLPIVNITNPPSDLSVPNSTTSYDFSGTASDSDGTVSKIEYRVRSSSWQAGSGTADWNFTADLETGPNLVEVRAQDNDGAYSDIKSRTITRSGRATKQILSVPSGEYVIHPCYSPYGTKISYGMYSPSEGFDIWVMNYDGSGVPQKVVDDVFPADWQDDYILLLYSSWSPDGTKISYNKGEGTTPSKTFDIWTINSDGSGIPFKVTTTGNAKMPSWSPDGKKIAYTQGDTWDLWLINSDGTGTPVQITDSGFLLWPSWSPDGKQISYMSYDNAADTHNLWVVNSDGTGEPSKIVSNVAHWSNDADGFITTSWSPDGSKICYIQGESEENIEIWITNSDGSGTPEPITTGGNDRSLWPAWSPDGTKIVHSSYPPAEDHIDLYITDYLYGDDAFPAVNIVSPILNEQISGILDVIGTVMDNTSVDGTTILSSLSSWAIEYGEGEQPETWTNIVTSSTSKFNELLESWDTSSLASGKYTLRLKATDGVDENVQTVSVQIGTVVEPDTDAPVISNMIVVHTTDTTATITWITDEPSNSMVQYGTMSSTWGNYQWSENDAGMCTNHTVTLTGLTEDTMYYFRVGSTDASGNGPDLNSNATNPSAEDSFTTNETPEIPPPSIVDYTVDYANDTIDITYSKPNMQNANIEANYSFSPTLYFLTTGGSDDITYIGSNTYRLYMVSLRHYTVFTLTVSNITDAVGNPVTPNSIAINDNDNDNMADDWEMFWGIDDPVLDQDGDNLTNLQEYNYYISDGWNLNPKSDDTDTDDLPDGWEISNGLDPTDDIGNNGRDGDFDTDGWTNYEEYINSTNPNDDTDPVPTPPEIVEVNPHHNAGITDNTRVPNNTSFAVCIEDSDGIDTTDLESIKFTINDSDNVPYEYNLGNTTVVRVVKLYSTEDDDHVTKLWAIYDRSKDDTYGNVYPFGATVTISVDAKDKHQDWMNQGVYCFKIETQQQHEDAEANLPPIEAVDPNDPDLKGSYDEGIEVNSGNLEGAKIIYESNEPMTPTLGPTDELPSFDGNDADAVGVPMNLQPPTVFNTPVKLFIPCPGCPDVSILSVYRYNGTDWVLACDASGTVQPGGEGWMVPGSRVNHNNGSPSTIEIQVYHFTGVQAAASITPQPPAPTPSGGGGGGGCFIATAAYGTAMEPHVKVLRDFRDRFLMNNNVGKVFINLYHAYSPSVADFIANHDTVRLMVRWNLLPLVGVSWFALNIGLIPTVIIILLMLIFINISVVVLFRRIRMGTDMA